MSARAPAAAARAGRPGERGQAAIALVGLLAGVLVLAAMLGTVARGTRTEASAQRAADLGALAGARAMHSAFDRRLALDGTALDRAAYLAGARAAAARAVAANGGGRVTVSFPQADRVAPTRIRVAVARTVVVSAGEARARAEVAAHAEAEVTPGAGHALGWAAGGGYDGPLAYRQGRPMRPDVAQAFDRLAAAARADGVALVVVSGFRSDAEQAVLFARNPDPRMVAPPGRSLHRNGTELDLAPAAAYGWLAAHARAHGFVRRYQWEPWHYGFERNARSAPRRPVAEGRRGGGDGGAHDHERGGGVLAGLSFAVPAAHRRAIVRASSRWNVAATLLAAQLFAESGFDPRAVSHAGAAGIAQFMPATARAYGLHDRFDPAAAIDAQAHLMSDLLRRFGTVPLALAAYNAGPAAVAACGCVPPYAETSAYVAKILALMGGAGDPVAGADLAVRLVR